MKYNGFCDYIFTAEGREIMKKMRAALWVIILVLACAGCGNAGGGLSERKACEGDNTPFNECAL